MMFFADFSGKEFDICSLVLDRIGAALLQIGAWEQDEAGSPNRSRRSLAYHHGAEDSASDPMQRPRIKMETTGQCE